MHKSAANVTAEREAKATEDVAEVSDGARKVKAHFGSAVELTASGLALWCLLPENPLPLLSFLALYAVAISAALVSHVPGGVGVFEAVMLLAAGPHLPTAQLLGALLLYRGLYYVLPLVLAGGLLVAYELRPSAMAPMGRAAVRQSPRLLAALTLVAGLWLVVSGVTPFTRDAREVLVALNVPLPLIELRKKIWSNPRL